MNAVPAARTTAAATILGRARERCADVPVRFVANVAAMEGAVLLAPRR
jgi:hypothetical protein